MIVRLLRRGVWAVAVAVAVAVIVAVVVAVAVAVVSVSVAAVAVSVSVRGVEKNHPSLLLQQYGLQVFFERVMGTNFHVDGLSAALWSNKTCWPPSAIASCVGKSCVETRVLT